METMDLLTATRLASAQLTLLECRAMFTDDISRASLENRDKIRLHLRDLRPRNAETASLAGDHEHVTTVDLSAPIKPVANTTGHRSTSTNNLRSTIHEEEDQDVMLAAVGTNSDHPHALTIPRAILMLGQAYRAADRPVARLVHAV